MMYFSVWQISYDKEDIHSLDPTHCNTCAVFLHSFLLFSNNFHLVLDIISDLKCS